AVFVPVAFLGGMTGILYRQFALTITISMALSAFTALSLTPALCAKILKPKKNSSNAIFNIFNSGFDWTKNTYIKIVVKLMRQSRLSIIFMVIVCGLTALIYQKLPSTFVPNEDRGMFVVSLNLPEGTSSNHSRVSIDKIADEVAKLDCVNYLVAHSGDDILSSSTKPNAAVMFVRLKNWDERKTPETQIEYLINKVRKIGQEVAPEAQVLVFNPAALPSLGFFGGWTMQLQDMSGHTDTELNEITNQILKEMNKRSELQGVRTTYRINSPIYNFKIDRDKVNKLGVDLSDVFTALQVNFGGMQVNDFNQFGRSYKVMLQSDMMYRSDVEAIKFIFVKNSVGEMIPLDTLLKPELNTGTSIISRFNASRSITIQGSAGDGYSSGQAIKTAEEVVREVAPLGFNIEWSGQSREEKKSSDMTMQILVLSIVFVFLCLAALYESWSVPYAVLMTVPIGIFGALFSEYVLNLQNSVYVQIGIIMLIGLAAKNAILIVEFAKVRVGKGMNPVKATIEAASLRLRPILMTSFVFIIGCLPLALATGAVARNGMGVAVVGGMLFTTSLGIFLTPVFFVMTEYISTIFKRIKS
ncbi:MAG: efflux RND transporter permease subunit, partial [Selenomonadaceae bacterium]|nr:efflux RND transporter permease subunit [Selenomonadaceae bacterium]